MRYVIFFFNFISQYAWQSVLFKISLDVKINDNLSNVCRIFYIIFWHYILHKNEEQINKINYWQFQFYYTVDTQKTRLYDERIHVQPRSHGRDKRRPSSLEGFHGSLEKDHSTKLRIISERVVVEGVILTCRTPLLRRWEITRREKEAREMGEPRENERANGARRRYRSTNEQERDVAGPKGGRQRER